jgi:hypothetical protein
MPECVLRVDWIGIIEVILAESVVATFSIALVSSSPCTKPLPLVVSMDEGGCRHQQFGITV